MTHVDWHPYPEEKPKKYGRYLITYQVEGYPAQIRVCDFYAPGSFYWNREAEEEVKAWAELPEPYQQPELLDMHPDAITARKYAEGDPETVKALHIFDE